jgi:hypothetical protein
MAQQKIEDVELQNEEELTQTRFKFAMSTCTSGKGSLSLIENKAD